MPNPDTTGTLINLEDRLSAKYGQNSFLCCTCQDGVSAGFFPVMTHDAQGAFLRALVCSACENEIEFSFGRPG